MSDRTIYLAMARYEHEGSSPVFAFETEDAAKAAVEAWNAYIHYRPDAPRATAET